VGLREKTTVKYNNDGMHRLRDHARERLPTKRLSTGESEKKKETQHTTVGGVKRSPGGRYRWVRLKEGS